MNNPMGAPIHLRQIYGLRFESLKSAYAILATKLYDLPESNLKTQLQSELIIAFETLLTVTCRISQTVPNIPQFTRPLGIDLDRLSDDLDTLGNMYNRAQRGDTL